MADANEKDEALKSELSPEKDTIEKDETPLSSLSNTEEEQDEEEEEDDEEEPEEEKANNGENALLVVKNEELETNKENVIKKDAKKAEESKNSEKSGENTNAIVGSVEEEEDEEEEENDEGDSEEEKANNGENAMLVVKNEELETNKETAVKEDAEKAEEPKNKEKSGENSSAKKGKEPKTSEKSGENSKAKKAKESINREKSGENSNVKNAKAPKNSEKSDENSNAKKAKEPKNSEKSGENSNAKKAKVPKHSEKSGENSNVKKAKEPQNSEKSGENLNAKKVEDLKNREKPGENSNAKKAKGPKNSQKSGENSNVKGAKESKNNETSGENSNAKIANEPKNSEKSVENSNAKEAKEPKNSEKRNGARNKNMKHDEQKESVTLAVNGDKPVSSKKKKGSKRVESMGMVFMCSSKTKADCFRYKILGLPENKKDQVLKIYKGMRLFLFDVDLRLMYGIFKAAGPGGYNIEPRAFKSEFPSQVRFTVLDDCLPLAEEKFKNVLKENYYTRNKFGGLLKSDQVKKLCKLFVKASRGGARSKSAVNVRKTQLTEARRLRRDEIRGNQPDDRNTSRSRKTRKRRARDEERRPHSPPVREKRRYTDYDHDRSRVLYDHEPPVPRYHPAPPPAALGSPVRLYTYERQPLDIPSYVHDHVPEHHTYPVLDRDQSWDRDPYPVYSREPPLYHNTVYPAPPDYHLVSRDYNHPPPIRTPEYHITGASRVANYRDVETARDYHSSALPLPEYHSTRSRYRY